MANITKVYLLSVPLEKDYAHTLYFGNTAAQQSYFRSKIKKSYTDFSYQRKDGIIRVPEHIDDLIADGCNYVMYQNAAYSNRWFYAFIENMEYINDGRTDVKIRTDCIQTWMDDITVMPSFVEREHAASDELGEHTVPEGLELGEYTANLHTRAEYGGDIFDSCVVVGVTKDSEGKTLRGAYYNGLYSGVRYYGFTSGMINAGSLDEFLVKYDAEAIGESIVCMFMAPKQLSTPAENGVMPFGNVVARRFINYSGSYSGDLFPGQEENNSLIGMTTHTIDGYTPRNAKLLTFPYRYLLVSNNAGASVPFKYERFYRIDGKVKTFIPPEFIIEGVLTPGCSVRMVPLHYNGVDRNDDEGINLGKYPILNWTSDVYTNWLTQNGVNIAIDVISGVGQIVAGAAIAVGSGGLGAAVGGGSIVGGVSQVANTLTQIHQQSFAAPQVKGNLNSGDVVTASDQNDFHFYDMTIKAEYAKIIDEYFDMYGYKCNRVKIPEEAHRAAYWYTKTIDVNITGEIPQEDLQVIKDCYNRGITFWRTSADFRNYDPVVNPNTITKEG